MATEVPIPNCTCCAKREAKTNKILGYENELVVIPGTTQNKKLPVLACPYCDGPVIKLSRKTHERQDS
jgi:alkyl hydroperoxide reductase subunit AhpF